MTARVDANVILRYLTDEPQVQAQRAARLLSAGGNAGEPLWLEEVVVAEVVWTLTSFYRFSRAEVSAGLLKVLGNDRVGAADKDAMRAALALFAERNLDFADALLASKAQLSGDPVIYSFDRDFDRVPGVTRREP